MLKTEMINIAREHTEELNVSFILFSQVVSIAIAIRSQIYFPHSVDMTWG
jgi:hypothetical protein